MALLKNYLCKKGGIGKAKKILLFSQAWMTLELLSGARKNELTRTLYLSMNFKNDCMNGRFFLKTLLLYISLICAAAPNTSAQNARIKIDLERTVGEVNKHI